MPVPPRETFPRRALRLLTAAGGLALVVACEQHAEPRQAAPPRVRPTATNIRGTGAALPGALYSHWAVPYFDERGFDVVYRASESGRAVAALDARDADFAASEVPLPEDEVKAHGLVQFPLVVGAVTPVVNLPGVAKGGLRLAPAVIAGIYLGRITRWSDPRVAAHNPKLTLPDREIIPIYRAGSSGANWILTRLLSAASPDWRTAIGQGHQPAWPVGVPATSSAQMARFVGRFTHTIGYVVLAEARTAGLSTVQIRNRAGAWAAPTREAVAAAISGSPWQEGPHVRLDLSAPGGEGSWPLVGTCYVLLPQRGVDPSRAERTRAFFRWALTRGAGVARSLDFIPLPAPIADAVTRSLTPPAGAPAKTP